MYIRPWLKALIALVCVFLILLMWNTIERRKQADAEQAAYTDTINTQTWEYMEEKARLLDELSMLQKRAPYVGDQAKLMIGFIMTDIFDIGYVQQKATAFQFSPVLLIDCSKDISEIAGWVEAADPGWDLLLYVPQHSAETTQQITDVRAYLQSVGRKDVNILALYGNYSNTQLSSLLSAHNMDGYLKYTASPSCGQNDDGTVYFDYSRFKAENFTYDSISSLDVRLNMWYNNKAAMLCIFDMALVHSGAVADSQLDTVIGKLQSSVNYPSAIFSTVSEVVEDLKKYNEYTAELNILRNQRIQEIHHRIDSLNILIHELYGK